MTGRDGGPRGSPEPGRARSDPFGGADRSTAIRWSRALVEGVGIALESLRANKVRSGLTVLGVAIGVLVVMVMAAVIQGIDRNFKDLLASRGVNTFYVYHAPMGGGAELRTGLEEEDSPFLRNPPIQPEWAEDLQALPGIREASPLADLTQAGYEGRWRDGRIELALVAVGANWLEIDAGEIMDGRFYSGAEARRGRPVAVIDSAAALDLYAGLDPLDEWIGVQGRGQNTPAPFRVVGVYRRPPNLFAQAANHYAYIPFEAARKYVSFRDRLVTIIVRPAEEASLPVVLDRVRVRLRQLRGLRPGEPDDFEIITQDEILNLWSSLTSVLFAVMVGLSSVGLMVGGVGVVGIMMISVTERTREIGIRKAIGARRRDILWQFLVEASTLTVVGGTLGLLFGGAIVWALQAFTPVPTSVPAWAVAAALGVSALTGIGFGLYPASRGARLDPVDALRYE